MCLQWEQQRESAEYRQEIGGLPPLPWDRKS